ncbi:tRNA (adenosine(37)-N6)-dimethylallyltransferase MiaA [Parvularcula sp. ZS-1/3]|uniref:tRNA dimethylallyltransferase n=1 Tax=Parvularcula mediterranea TaxID=2732508 RepID=A0A7Y3W618_9PROT|nr:tRNA (adenosine(37)-N6)-dimethylallyltransferase MiaA [Parvularcula mediterranea]NNU17360.1 tRNA (adenosine(37)-N6)-dimethylallyltransferase MiaA [Parvularcula mediterranea]
MTSQDGPPLLVVAGPTASGKSAAATILASMHGGHVINADSMQVYRDLRVVSARPGPEEQRRAPHHLYGHIDAADRFSAGRFVAEAAPLVEGIRAGGSVPVLCGGTGMYLKALLEGLSPVPEIEAGTVEDVTARWEADPRQARAELLEVDPAMERLEPSDRQRHIRALSVHRQTGKSLSDWQAIPPQPALTVPAVCAVLLPEREALYARIEARFDRMIEEGATEEVRQLLARELPEDLPAMKALGVPEIAAFVRGEVTMEEAVEKAKQETRRFAKRQMTWFRNQTDWPSFETPEALVEYLQTKL